MPRLRSLIGSGTGADRSLQAQPQPSVAGVINRNYVATRQGRLLMRCIPGQGRPLVMLHASPTSSALLEPLMMGMAAGRPVIAFDTPGNGDSDPPGRRDDLQITHFSDIMNEALSDLAFPEIDLYGTHTGALIAMEVAIANPRVRCLILEGVTLFDDGERPDLLPRSELLATYLPRFDPVWDGTHLQSAWHFRRSFTLYWPWYRRSRSGIRWVPMVDLAPFHRAFVEMLKRIDTYHLPYRAALAYPTQARLPHIRIPTLIAASPHDPLQAHTTEAAGMAPRARSGVLPDDLEGTAALYEDFLSGMWDTAR